MTQPGDLTTDLVSVGIKALKGNAFRMGLTWRMRLGTVTAVSSNPDVVEARLDGDSVSISMVSMIGPLSLDDRVYVITIPPAGNYVVGFVASSFLGPRVATTVLTAASGTFTTAETLVASVTANLVFGRVYRITFDGAFNLTVDGVIRVSIRENSVAGTILTVRDSWVDNGGTASVIHAEVEYTATTTGSKTFVATGDVLVGAGTGNLNAAANFPSYMYVDYIRE